jgi:hypothetical protein
MRGDNCVAALLRLQARQHIQERDFLIAAHIRSEQSLATHAENLTDELARATDEIAALHAKIERKAAVEEANLGVASQLQAEASQKFTEFEQDIGRNQGIQQGHHADIQGYLEQFKSRSAEELQSMRTQVSSPSPSPCPSCADIVWVQRVDAEFILCGTGGEARRNHC